MTKKYKVDKKKKTIINGYINYEGINGFDITPQNKISYEGVKVGHLKLVNPSLIEKVLKRKTKRKLTAYLNFLISETEGEDDGDALEIVINDVERYKDLIINKYAKFLDKRYIRSLLKKINLVEIEIRAKIEEIVNEKEVSIGRKR